MVHMLLSISRVVSLASLCIVYVLVFHRAHFPSHGVHFRVQSSDNMEAFRKAKTVITGLLDGSVCII